MAEGLVELARQMAPSVALHAAGGTDDGGLGTSFEKVSAAIVAADGGAGVVVLCDLGSAILTAETALELVGDDVRDRIRIADAPFVEGGLAAAVAAETGEGRDAVADAGEAAWAQGRAERAADESEALGDSGAYRRSVVLKNADGLHARPAAELVKLASTFNAHVTVNGKDARSLLGIMSLGLTKGMTAEISAPDGQAREAVDALVELIESGFGQA